jgi:hypothetical protein
MHVSSMKADVLPGENWKIPALKKKPSRIGEQAMDIFVFRHFSLTLPLCHGGYPRPWRNVPCTKLFGSFHSRKTSDWLEITENNC